jgi:hypothetical protein
MLKATGERTSCAGRVRNDAGDAPVVMKLRSIRTVRDHYRRVARACGVSGAHVRAMAEIEAAPKVDAG